MAVLTIVRLSLYETTFKPRISYKLLNKMSYRDLYNDDLNSNTTVWSGTVAGFKINSHTAKIDEEELVLFLKTLQKHRPFNKIKLLDSYSLTADELLKKSLE